MPLPQLPLPLLNRHWGQFEDYVYGANVAVVEHLQQVLVDSDQFIFLHGPAASGKTHLLSALCQAAGGQLRVAYLPAKKLGAQTVAYLEQITHIDLVCLDDVDCLAGDKQAEEALFHCYNRLKAEQSSLVVSSRLAPAALPVGLADLRTRLSWGTAFLLKPADDDDRREILKRYAAVHGVRLDQAAIGYLLSRGRRNLSDLLALVDRVQNAAFVEKRLITLPLIRRVMRDTD